jgi:hypothetical protein
MSILSEFTPEEIESVIEENPFLRGYIQGYLAEVSLRKQLLLIPGITEVTKIPDSSSEKGDLKVIYKNQVVTIEVKSICTKSVRQDVLNDTWQGTVSVKASDKKEIFLEGVGMIDTISLVKGTFDILAISCYAVSNTWDFMYITNEYLPEKSFKLPGLIKSSFVINPSTTPCVTSNIVSLLEEVILKKQLGIVKIKA